MPVIGVPTSSPTNFTPSLYLVRVKRELRITLPTDDTRLLDLIQEAATALQEFLSLELVDEGTVADETTQVALTPLHLRYITVYVAMQYTMDEDLKSMLDTVLLLVRDL